MTRKETVQVLALQAAKLWREELASRTDWDLVGPKKLNEFELKLYNRIVLELEEKGAVTIDTDHMTEAWELFWSAIEANIANIVFPPNKRMTISLEKGIIFEDA